MKGFGKTGARSLAESAARLSLVEVVGEKTERDWVKRMGEETGRDWVKRLCERTGTDCVKGLEQTV